MAVTTVASEPYTLRVARPRERSPPLSPRTGEKVSLRLVSRKRRHDGIGRPGRSSSVRRKSDSFRRRPREGRPIRCRHEFERQILFSAAVLAAFSTRSCARVGCYSFRGGSPSDTSSIRSSANADARLQPLGASLLILVVFVAVFALALIAVAPTLSTQFVAFSQRLPVTRYS